MSKLEAILKSSKAAWKKHVRSVTTRAYNRLSAQEVKLPEFYQKHRKSIDNIVLGSASVLAGAEIASDVLDTSLLLGAAAVGGTVAASLVIPKVADKIYTSLKKRSEDDARKAYAAVYVGVGFAAVGALHKLLHMDDSVYSQEFWADAVSSIPEYAMVFGGTYAALEIIQYLCNKTEIRKSDKRPTRVFKRSARTVMTALGLTYAAYQGVETAVDAYKESDWHSQDIEFPKCEGCSPKQEKHLQIGIKANGERAINHGEIIVEDGNMITLDIQVENAKQYAGKDLTVRYYMFDTTNGEVPKEDSWFFYHNLISLGERSDLHVENTGVGLISGIFEYDASLASAYEEGAATINPRGDAPSAKTYKFLVEILADGKEVDRKWWGEGAAKDYRFTFAPEETIEEPTPPIARVNSGGKKHVFIYNQALGSNKMQKETLAVADYWHPHLWEFQKSPTSVLKLKQRCSEKVEDKVKADATQYGIKVLPMVSAFNNSLVDRVLDNPSTAARLIGDHVKEEKYAGVAVDLETISMGSERSGDLVEFLRRLRQELPAGKYEIAVAMSPRFEGSAEHGYRHHGLYDYEGIARYADWLHLMAYDFHRGRRGASPVLPEDKIDDIVRYAVKHAPAEKVVMLMPFYGYVWTTGGSPVGTISAHHNNKYIDNARSSKIDNGELRVVTADRIAYLQTPDVFERRLNELDQLGITNAGGWRQTHATAGIYQEFGQWKK
ncbi:hypothetical protein HZA99_05015 [Candidatus Woesearchaeota archaeon]|nr:hypothetical protein [Candidatus Woesearchaeota archaeon]